jgi:hypothetical protein
VILAKAHHGRRSRRLGARRCAHHQAPRKEKPHQEEEPNREEHPEQATTGGVPEPGPHGARLPRGDGRDADVRVLGAHGVLPGRDRHRGRSIGKEDGLIAPAVRTEPRVLTYLFVAAPARPHAPPLPERFRAHYKGADRSGDTGRGINALPKLRARYGGTNWRKCKGEATIELPNGMELIRLGGHLKA